MNFHLLAFGCLGASGVYMSWSDLIRRRLPNAASASLGLAGLAAGLILVGTNYAFSSLIHVLIALGVGFCVFALNLIGSGDVKYYAAVGAWFPLTEAFRLLGWVALVGFLIALIWLAKAHLASELISDDEADYGKVPFGLAIAGGAVLAGAGLFQ